MKHFKYKLYMDCSSIVELDGVEDEPVKDTVERLFSHLEETEWIQKVWLLFPVLFSKQMKVSSDKMSDLMDQFWVTVHQ